MTPSDLWAAAQTRYERAEQSRRTRMPQDAPSAPIVVELTRTGRKLSGANLGDLMRSEADQATPTIKMLEERRDDAKRALRSWEPPPAGGAA